MFSEFARYLRIFVTGPQRSGTRIAAKMIADDTGHEYVDETRIYSDSLSHAWRLLRQEKPGKRLVIQCPGLCRWIHLVAESGDLIVFMMRDPSDVKASESRIGWRYDEVELWKYDGKLGHDSRTATVDFWQADQIELAMEAGVETKTLEYDELRHHALWRARGSRSNFRWNQID